MPSIKVTGFVPKQLFDLDAIRLELLNALRSEGREIKRDFQATTKTWKRKPRFDMKVSLRRAQATGFVEVKTDNEIYGYVNYGTKPHIIRPKVRRRGPRGRFRRAAGALAFRKSRPKTMPYLLSSGPGGKVGPTIIRPFVRHPGGVAREFDKAIRRKIEKTGRFQRRLDQALTRGLRKSYKGTRMIG